MEIGNGTVLYSGVKIYHGCKVGAGCIIHAGCVIGSDGFGFAPQKDGSYMKISQIGSADSYHGVQQLLYSSGRHS